MSNGKKFKNQPENSPNQDVSLKTNILKQKKIIVVLFVLLVIALLPSIYFFNQYNQAKSSLNTSANATAQEVDVVIEKVGRLYDLPINEVPTLATVSDKSKLSSQAFFAKAENGDKVLIYSIAKKAILYRPSTDKIIELSAINLPSSPTPSAASGAEGDKLIKEYQVVLYNGTTSVGLTLKYQNELEAKTKAFIVADRSNADKRDYKENLVIDLNKNLSNQAEELAKLVDGKVVPLPDGEDAPAGADFLVILGVSR